MDIFQTIANALADRYGLDASEILPETELISIGVDSLDAAELLMELEDKIGVEIEPTKKLATIKDVVATGEAAQNEAF
ncbi:MAG: acyl carrier protein [Thermoguttaceae bacterium]|nr:acyl carrier protein [Thermoguttaceae bacterium]